MIEISSFKEMLGNLKDFERDKICDLFEVLRTDFREMKSMLNEADDMLRGIFPWTKDVSENAHRASLRVSKVSEYANSRAALMYDLLESVK